MGLTTEEQQITWPTAATSVAVSAGGNATSEAFTPSPYGSQVHLKADNAGTPASGDVVNVYLLQSGGDPDGAGTDEYDAATPESAILLARLDTAATGNDPAYKTVTLPTPQKSAKLFVESEAGSNSITVSATRTDTVESA